MSKNYNFFYPQYHYRGKVKPENMVFNANLQEFSHKVNYISNLQTGGKITSLQAYCQIKALWKRLSQSKQGLGIGDNPFEEGYEA